MRFQQRNLTLEVQIQVLWGIKHGGHPLSQESAAQLRQLDRAACVFCGTIRLRQVNCCNHCKEDTATRSILVGDTCQDRRQQGYQDAAASQPLPSTTSQSIPQGDLPWRRVHFTSEQPQNRTDSRFLISAESGRCQLRAAWSPGTFPRGQRVLREVWGCPWPISLPLVVLSPAGTGSRILRYDTEGQPEFRALHRGADEVPH